MPRLTTSARPSGGMLSSHRPLGEKPILRWEAVFVAINLSLVAVIKKSHLSRLMMLGIGAIVYNAHKWSGPCEGPALIEAAITHSALCKPSLPLSLTFPLTFYFDSCRRRTLLTWTPKVVPALNWPSSTPEAGFGLWWQGEVPRWSTGTTSPQEKDLLIKKNNVGHRRFFLIDPDIHWKNAYNFL